MYLKIRISIETSCYEIIYRETETSKHTLLEERANICKVTLAFFIPNI